MTSDPKVTAVTPPVYIEVNLGGHCFNLRPEQARLLISLTLEALGVLDED